MALAFFTLSIQWTWIVVTLVVLINRMTFDIMDMIFPPRKRIHYLS